MSVCDHGCDAGLSDGGRAFFVDGCDVDDGLEGGGRLYLVGHLQREQPLLQHVDSLAEDTEIGITYYQSLTVDQPHVHSKNVDFAFVMAGTFAVRIIPTGEVRVLGRHGLLAIEPGVEHICIAHPGTRVLFMKTPGGDDKTVVELDEASRAWVEEYCAGVGE